MFEASGIKIAVENADKVLKDKADVVVASNNRRSSRSYRRHIKGIKNALPFR